MRTVAFNRVQLKRLKRDAHAWRMNTTRSCRLWQLVTREIKHAKFYLEAEIVRSAMEKKVTVGGASKYIRVRRPTGNVKHPDYEVIRWKPATYQLVEVYSPGSFHPIYCGKSYVDSKGLLNGTFYCGNAYPTKLYLQFRGDSRRGFRVGSSSPWPWGTSRSRTRIPGLLTNIVSNFIFRTGVESA